MRTLIVAGCLVAALLLPRSIHAAWGPLDAGMNSAVYSITNFDGELIAGGAFSQAGGVPVSHIAKWNGTSWSPLGMGVGGTPEPRVYAMIVYDGSLIAAGNFSGAGGHIAWNIARWDGTSWSPLGTGVDGTVYALTIYQGLLIAGGDFIHAGGTEVNCIAQWDGSSWSGLGSGLGCDACGNDFAVLSLGVHADEVLVAGGWFNLAGGVPANYIASWRGTWAPLGAGMDYPVSAITDYNGDLIAGGAFSHAGGQVATGIARWDGASWSPLGDGVVGWYNWVRALAVYNGGLVAGGYFVEAGGEPANHIARWARGSWNVLDQGTDGSVVSLAVSEGLLIAGGSFEQAGGVGASRIAVWSDPPAGACCFVAACEVYSRANCAAHGGIYEGDGTLCAPDPCPTSSAEEESQTPAALSIHAIPNPSGGDAVFRYELPAATTVTLEIFDAGGSLVRRITEGPRPAGRYSIPWNALDSSTHPAPSGVYLARITTSEGTKTARVVLAK